MERELIAGPNFSGRSQALKSKLQRSAGETFFLGPYAEAALSGLSSTVADEIAVYARGTGDRSFTPLDWESLGRRKPATLSGGEQVLLALHCFSRSSYGAIGIDTALEQLDVANRAAALRFLGREAHPCRVTLIDNRLEQVPAGWTRRDLTAASADYACDLAGLSAELRPRGAPVITITGMDFSYRSGRPIFRDLDLTLEPGKTYRLLGPNGAGKTTFFKLLVGVLEARRGAILLDQAPYRPRRSGNRAFALAAQNPDHQWCGATLAEDVARRRRALGVASASAPSDRLLASLARKLGIHTPDQLLYELPLAARKRLGWLWPFSGAMPWVMLDEPTIGQDRDTRLGLAAIVSRLCEIGYGVIVVTHDDDFAAGFPHLELRIEDMTIHA
jgi:energy-coupling factor transporter ATP-binding protein EcfA2